MPLSPAQRTTAAEMEGGRAAQITAQTGRFLGSSCSAPTAQVKLGMVALLVAPKGSPTNPPPSSRFRAYSFIYPFMQTFMYSYMHVYSQLYIHFFVYLFTGKLGIPRIVRSTSGKLKGTGGRGGRRMAALAALLNGKRIVVIGLMTGILMYGVSISRPDPVGLSVQSSKGKRPPPLSAPTSQPSGGKGPPQQLTDGQVTVPNHPALPYAQSAPNCQ